MASRRRNHPVKWAGERLRPRHPDDELGGPTAGDRRGHTVLRRAVAVASVLTVLATMVSGAGWLTLNKLSSNITTVDVTKDLGPRPTKATPTQPEEYEPVNILVMGTDTRTGQGSGFGIAADTSSGTGHSDTTILFHISGDRQSAIAVSIPRDSWVTRPVCKGSGTHHRAHQHRVRAGRCRLHDQGDREAHRRLHRPLRRRRLRRLQVRRRRARRRPRLPHHRGQRREEPPQALAPATHLLTGDQALAFARVRHGIGDGSDISRIGRQQDFLSSIIRAATDKGLLLDPTKLYSVLSAITGSLTTDPEMGKFDYEQQLADEPRGDPDVEHHVRDGARGSAAPTARRSSGRRRPTTSGARSRTTSPTAARPPCRPARRR